MTGLQILGAAMAALPFVLLFILIATSDALRGRLIEAKTKQDAAMIEADWLKIRASYDDDEAAVMGDLIAQTMRALPNA